MSNLNDVKNNSKDEISKTKNMLVSGVEEAKDVASSIKDGAKNLVSSGLEKTDRINDVFLEKIKNNPYKSLAIALFIGWVAGKKL